MCDVSENRWISRTAAARRLQINHHAVQALVERGCLTVRELPGMNPQVLAADVARLDRDRLRPARLHETTRANRFPVQLARPEPQPA